MSSKVSVFLDYRSHVGLALFQLELGAFAASIAVDPYSSYRGRLSYTNFAASGEVLANQTCLLSEQRYGNSARETERRRADRRFLGFFLSRSATRMSAVSRQKVAEAEVVGSGLVGRWWCASPRHICDSENGWSVLGSAPLRYSIQ